MAMYRAFSAYANTTQSITTSGLTNFIKDYGKVCNGISLENGNTVRITGPGVYYVAGGVIFTPTATGVVTLQLLNNGNVINGASVSVEGTASESVILPFSKLIKVAPSCVAVDNTANLTVQITSSGTIDGANISVIQ